jgi:hypothetical protein
LTYRPLFAIIFYIGPTPKQLFTPTSIGDLVSDFDTTDLVQYEDSDKIPSEATLSFYFGIATGLNFTGFILAIVGFVFANDLLVSWFGFFFATPGVIVYFVERFFYRKYYRVVQQGRVDNFSLFSKRRVRIRGYTRANKLDTRWVRVSREQFKKADFSTLIDLR